MSDDPSRYQVGTDKFLAPFDRSAKTSADPATVSKFHERSDVDSSAEAQHHTLGPKHDQAAAGDHSHQVGKGYKAPLTGVSITGSRAGGTALVSVIDALEKLGATDATVA